ncbi:oligosaccharide flippase family protein [Haloarcula sp. NS06]|uniref:oligosaccharide flippase family protein n=1 Tax=Haloarcula sp. NS06 TaxID=3409688 RepID=UPI003DA6E8CE
MSSEDELLSTNFGQQVISGTTARVITAAIGFVGSIYFARFLGPTVFGAVSLILALSDLAARPIHGVGAAAKKRVSERDSLRGPLLTILLGVSVGWSILITIIFIPLNNIINSMISVDYASLYLIGLIAATGTFTILGLLVTGRGKVSEFLWTNAIRKSGAVALQLALIISGFKVLGWALGLLIPTIGLIIILIALIDAKPAVPSYSLLRSIWDFARFSSISSLLYAAYSRLDLLLIGALVGTTAAGYYRVGWQITMLSIFLAETISDTIMPKISYLHQNGNSIELVDEIEKGLDFAPIISIPILFGAIGIGGPLITIIYGEDFSPAVSLVIFIAFIRVFMSLSNPVMAAIEGIDRPEVELRLTTVGLVFNLLFGIPLLYFFGPISLIIVSGFAELIRVSGGVLYLMRKFDDFSPTSRLHTIQLIAGIFMSVFLIFIQNSIVVDSIYSLSGMILCGGFLYAVILISMSNRVRNLMRAGLPIPSE